MVLCRVALNQLNLTPSVVKMTFELMELHFKGEWRAKLEGCQLKSMKNISYSY